MSRSSNNRHDDEWRFDKRIPLGIIITLLFQFLGALVWATQLDARVDRMEQQSIYNADLYERFARVEERLENVKQDTNTLKQLVGRIAERLIP